MTHNGRNMLMRTGWGRKKIARRMSLFIRGGRVMGLAMVLAVSVCAEAFASDIYWGNPAGGVFSVGSNWQGGVAPDADDRALFDLTSTYTVDFTADAATDWVLPQDGEITFDLGGFTYSILTGTSPGFWVTDASLTLTNGTLDASSTGGEIDGADGEVVVDNATLEWNHCYVGYDDNGALTVTNDGTVTNGAWVHVGSQVGGAGDATITGNGSTWTASDHIRVGWLGDGSLAIEDGATVTTTWSSIGGGSESIGTASVTGSGSTWTSSGWLTVGESGSGTLDITLGGEVTNTGSHIASLSDSVGEVTVSGAGSRWDQSDHLILGHEGSGTLRIEDGGTVSNTWCDLAEWESSDGLAIVTGPDAAWTNEYHLVLGVRGYGELQVEDGGSVSNTWSHIGSQADAVGLATITGVGSTWTLSDWLYVGDNGVGTLDIQDGGSVTALGIYVGTQAGSEGTVTISGEASSLDITGALFVSFLGDGAVTVQDGAAVTSPQTQIGGVLGSMGHVTVDGPGSVLISDGWGVSVGADYEEGQGTLEVTNGGLVSASQVRLEPNPAGLLIGDGTVQAPVWNQGRLEPGLSAGILTIDGDYEQESDGTLAIELGGTAPGTYDQLVITGNATLAGTLDLSLINGFDPQPGDSFEILTAASVTGAFDTIEGWDLGGGKMFYVTYSETDVTLHVDTVVGLEIIPSPAEIYLGFPLKLCAMGQLSLGGAADVSDWAAWSSDNPAIASVDETGEIRGETVGNTTIRASFGGFDAAAPVEVLPLPSGPLATERVSLSTAGDQGDNTSSGPVDISADDGRFVTFYSYATNLVAADTNGAYDVFVRDLDSGVTVRVSVDSSGLEGDGGSSRRPKISADGRFVTFDSSATNLVTADTNGMHDVFVHDRDVDDNGVFDEPGGIKTVRVSVDSSGLEGDAYSYSPHISADGRFITFQSSATNLVTDDMNQTDDVFVHDRDVDDNGVFDEPGGIKTVRVSVDSSGLEGDGGSYSPQISADGRFVAFYSDATNLVVPDTNETADVFVHDRDADDNGIYDEPGGIETTRVSVDSGGVEGNGRSYFGYISGDGRMVAFLSRATNLIADDTNPFRDVFVHDRQTGETQCVSVSSDGEQGTGDTGSVSISGDGRFVGYRSAADSLVPDDTNGESDVFRHDLLTGQTVRMSVSFFGGQSNGHSGWTALTDDGRTMAFYSDATNLVPFDTNTVSDVFVRYDWPGDCNSNGIPDECDLDCGPPDGPCDIPGCGMSEDCNTNAVPDECDISAGTSADANTNGIPDECEGCPYIYDLDNSCFVDATDLGLFAACWLLSEGADGWDENDCADKDFDCSGTVDATDLGLFAGAWLKSDDQVDPANYPECRTCGVEGIICPWVE